MESMKAFVAHRSVWRVCGVLGTGRSGFFTARPGQPEECSGIHSAITPRASTLDEHLEDTYGSVIGQCARYVIYS